MRRVLTATLCLAAAGVVHAQTNARLTLPQHDGAMVLNLDGWKTTETSAKPGGVEIGVRAHDGSNMGMLAFLFLTPGDTDQSATSCRSAELKQVAKQKPTSVDSYSGARGSEMATVTFRDHTTVHAYWGSGDQCLAIAVYPDLKTTLDTASAKAFLAKQAYDASVKPQSTNKLLYAEILFQHHAYAAAVPVYRDLLATLPSGATNLTVRRVATDDLAMALGISNDLAGTRRLLAEAIEADPTYPLNYFNLACADAEEGNAAAAKEHLQQAFDRRANAIATEHFPDPTHDDSLQKLKDNREFWSLATSISEQLKRKR